MWLACEIVPLITKFSKTIIKVKITINEVVWASTSLLFKHKFTEEERDSGLTNIVMGLSFITEGAIPFGAADPARAIPSFIVGSALTGALVGLSGIKLMAPHGGIFVIGLTNNPILYLVYVLIGAVVSGIIFGYLRKPLKK